MVIGIDVGTSTTKIVGLRDNEVISPIRIRATDPVTSLYGAFGKFLHDNGISLNEIKQVMLTGVGSAYVNEPIYGLSTSKAEEFMADGLGAQFESKQEHQAHWWYGYWWRYTERFGATAAEYRRHEAGGTDGRKR